MLGLLVPTLTTLMEFAGDRDEAVPEWSDYRSGPEAVTLCPGARGSWFRTSGRTAEPKQGTIAVRSQIISEWVVMGLTLKSSVQILTVEDIFARPRFVTTGIVVRGSAQHPLALT